MNRYILIRRLRGPAFLLLVGVIALLNEAHVLSWGHAWPLFLILAGVLLLAERAALSGADVPTYPAPGYAGPGYTGAPYGGTPYAAPADGSQPAAGNSIVPAQRDDYDTRGGQS